MIKKIAITLGILLVIVLLAGFAAQKYARHKLQTLLQVTSPTGDSIRFDRLDVDIFRGQLQLNDVIVHWVFNKDPSGSDLSYQLDGRAARLDLNGVDIWAYLFDKNYQADKLTLDGAVFTIIGREDTLRTADTTATAPAVKKPLPNIHIAEIQIGPTRLEYRKPTSERPYIEVDSFQLTGTDWSFPVAEGNSSFPKEVDWSARNFVYYNPTNLQILYIDKAQGNSRDSSLLTESVRVLPRLPAQQQWSQQPTQVTSITATFGSVDFHPINWNAILRDQKLISRRITIKDMDLHVLENESLALVNTTPKKFYQQQLLESPLSIEVDSILLQQSLLKYEIVPQRGGANGTLTFDNMYASLYNITNDSAALARQSHAFLDARARLNRESVLSMHFDFDLASPDYAFSYSGGLKDCPFSALNTILGATAYMQVTEGQVSDFSFNINASRYLAQGELLLKYDGLKIEWEEGHNMFMALGQKVFMREKNPKGNEKLRTGIVYREVTPRRTFWYLFYKSLVSGLQSTVMPNLFLPSELDVDKQALRQERREKRKQKQQKK